MRDIWWKSKDSAFSEGDKDSYFNSINTIKKSVEEVEAIQVVILKLLLNASDAPTYQQSSRALFLSKFRLFLKDHAPGSRVSKTEGFC